MEHYLQVKPDDREQIDTVFRILRRCGHQMARQGLFHWIPSYSRRAIRRDCAEKQVFLVWDDEAKAYTSTFQLHEKPDGNLWARKLAVDPSFRGRGIGTRDMTFMVEYARKNQYPALCLDVYAKSVNAIRLYEKLGFVTFGEAHTIRFRELLMKKTVNE